MTGEDIIRDIVADLLARSADAWAHDCPRLSSRLFAAARVALGDITLDVDAER